MERFLEPRTLARVKDLPLIARTVAEGFLHGIQSSHQRGIGVEFSQYRAYEPGDEPARIDRRGLWDPGTFALACLYLDFDDPSDRAEWEQYCRAQLSRRPGRVEASERDRSVPAPPDAGSDRIEYEQDLGNGLFQLPPKSRRCPEKL